VTFWQTIWLFSAPIGGAILGLLVYLDNRRDAKRLEQVLSQKR
jgi:hypothetical protein